MNELSSWEGILSPTLEKSIPGVISNPNGLAISVTSWRFAFQSAVGIGQWPDLVSQLGLLQLGRASHSTACQQTKHGRKQCHATSPSITQIRDVSLILSCVNFETTRQAVNCVKRVYSQAGRNKQFNQFVLRKCLAGFLKSHCANCLFMKEYCVTSFLNKSSSLRVKLCYRQSCMTAIMSKYFTKNIQIKILFSIIFIYFHWCSICIPFRKLI